MSSTVTVAVSDAEFPFTSVTVSVTVFAPTSAHVNAVMSRDIEAIPNPSDDPLSICSALIVALPVPSSNAVTS